MERRETLKKNDLHWVLAFGTKARAALSIFNGDRSLQAVSLPDPY